ncbi:MAG: hypothetical protein H0T89_14880, partial [Deltaproteobacteria bacterium]|nr:hypothetical protein [Deltaproteobacteria bacterium]
MSIDAAARERQVPVRRSRPESDQVPVARPAKPRKPGALSGLQIVLILVALFGGAYIKTEYFPSRRQQAQQREIDEIQRENRERSSAGLQRLEDLRMRSLPSTDVEACDRLTQLAVGTCKTAANAGELQTVIDRAIQEASTSSGAVAGCTATVSSIEAARARLRCDRASRPARSRARGSDAPFHG